MAATENKEATKAAGGETLATSKDDASVILPLGGNLTDDVRGEAATSPANQPQAVLLPQDAVRFLAEPIGTSIADAVRAGMMLGVRSPAPQGPQDPSVIGTMYENEEKWNILLPPPPGRTDANGQPIDRFHTVTLNGVRFDIPYNRPTKVPVSVGMALYEGSLPAGDLPVPVTVRYDENGVEQPEAVRAFQATRRRYPITFIDPDGDEGVQKAIKGYQDKARKANR